MRELTLLRRRPLSHRPSGFTLVELMIVVIILGILGTIIIALFSNSTQDAGANSLKENLRTMRSALQVYVAQHNGYPSVANFEAQMTQFTDADGNTATSRSDTYPYGPYILTMPHLPVGTNKGKTGVTGTTYADGFGWSFDNAQGTFKANLPDADVDIENKAFNTY
jgi:prepilin-type N-terminal cleavage/methylation domain-containing protein